MDHSQTPVLEALAAYQAADHQPFTPPGHKHGRGADPECGRSSVTGCCVVAGPHEKLLVGRDVNKSVVAGLILAGIRPPLVEPQWDPQRHLAHPPAPAAYEAASAEHPDARGALVTSPTPYGACADLAAITAVCHEHDVPVITDEAWGCAPTFPPRPAHQGHGRRSGPVRHLGAQDGLGP